MSECRRLHVLPSCPFGITDYDCFWHFVRAIASICSLFVLMRYARCNQQIAASSLLVKDADVTRSIVQKAVVVLASKPLFGPIRSVELSFREYVYD